MSYKTRTVKITVFDKVNLEVLGMFSEEDNDYIADYVRYNDEDITDQVMKVDFLWDAITDLALEKCHGNG